MLSVTTSKTMVTQAYLSINNKGGIGGKAFGSSGQSSWPQHLSEQRSFGGNRAAIVWPYTTPSYNYAQLLWNWDEPGLCVASASDKVLAKHGARVSMKQLEAQTGLTSMSFLVVQPLDAHFRH